MKWKAVMSNIPKGYKQTEVGVIPSDWGVKVVEDISEVKSGKRLPLGKSLIDSETAHPYIRVIDMFQGGVSLMDIKYVPDEVYSAIKNYRIFKGDIFISVAGTLGIVGKIPVELDGANLTENADRLTNINCNRDYLLYVFMSSLIQNVIESERTLGAQPKLALTRIRKFQIPLPSTKAEQTAIAAALSDADTLISSLEQLIAKKRDIKQGAMQELLTAKKRLPGFSGEWEVKKLGEIANIFKGSGISKSKLNPSGIHKCILYGELFTTYSQVIKNVISRTNADEGVLSKKGDILMPGSTTTIGIDLAIASALLEDGILLGGDINIIRKKVDSYDSEFIAHYLTQVKKHEIAELSQGITIIHLYGRDLNALSITIPAKREEQTAIAQILSDMDTEIEQLEQKLFKYRLLKQGMMQELLTGKTRLI